MTGFAKSMACAQETASANVVHIGRHIGSSHKFTPGATANNFSPMKK